jgi:hypothetical protein
MNTENTNDDKAMPPAFAGYEPCLICGRPVPGYTPDFCCSGTDCGCSGQPINPCVCSDDCYSALFEGIGKPYDERRVIAGIAKWHS